MGQHKLVDTSSTEITVSEPAMRLELLHWNIILTHNDPLNHCTNISPEKSFFESVLDLHGEAGDSGSFELAGVVIKSGIVTGPPEQLLPVKR